MFDCEYFEKLLDIYAEHIIYKIFIYILYIWKKKHSMKNSWMIIRLIYQKGM